MNHTPAHPIGAELRRAGIRDVSDSTLTRAMYSTDASLYRVVPQVVVKPYDHDEVEAVVNLAREFGVGITARGAGTSVAGNAVGEGIVLDFSAHMNAILAIDAEQKTARVQPGVVQAALQDQARGHGLRFGPDPSTYSRCTIGGMIGNNACGPRALGYGRTAENVVELRTASYLAWPEAELQSLVNANLAVIRTEFGRFSRQVSGYSLEHLLPERSFDVNRFLVGSEATLALVTEATVALVDNPEHTVMVVLGYPSMADAGDDVVSFLHLEPAAIEGLDSRIVDVFMQSRPTSVELPQGAGWLFIEFAGNNEAALRVQAEAAIKHANTTHARLVTEPEEQAFLWRIREEGAGLAALSFDRQAKSGWEDSAVPPEQLGSYLRGLDALMDDFGFHGAPYGHFGEGCVHVRIDFDPAENSFRDFIEAAADLVAAHSGSMSGEHGDGRARSELLPKMYSPGAMELFAQVKKLWDPENIFNPGVLVNPNAFDSQVRGVGLETISLNGPMKFVHDKGDFSSAVHRCTGVGKCLANNNQRGQVMCPSYQATRNEKDSTRGRARVLQEMVDGRLVTKSWDSPELHDALDLCLSCKGCASDCPTGVDMATYKSQWLYERYRNRLRPRSHYILGRLPALARKVHAVVWLVNLSLKTPGLRSLARWFAGVDQRRSLPTFARTRFSKLHRSESHAERPRVALWADSFTEYFDTEAGVATVAVLESAGYSVELVNQRACCGLTWISTGQLDQASRELANTIEVLAPYAQAGIPVIGVEPSCLATLRSDAEQLVDHPMVQAVVASVHTLSELLLKTPGWSAPDLSGMELIVQPHCHHSSILGFEADQKILAQTGAQVTQLAGCCGLAGNFGVEKGHYEVSVAVAEQQLLPAITANPGATIVADGFSCRTQTADLAGKAAQHLAQILAP